MLGTSWADSPLYFCNRKSAITLKKELDCRDGCGYASEINGVPAATEAKRWIAQAESMMGVRVTDGETDADPSTASDSGTAKAPTTSTGSQSRTWVCHFHNTPTTSLIFHYCLSSV